MATANFYLKDPSAKEETLIYLFFSYNGRRLKFSTGEKIYPKYWNSDPDTQRAKKSMTGSPELNGYLDKVEEEAKKIYRNTKSNGATLTVQELREKLINGLDRKTLSQKNFFDYLNEFTELGKGIKKHNTLKKYRTLRNHLLQFQQRRKFNISFETIDSKFYESFHSFYINDLRLLNNSIGKYISTLKTFLHWATERGYNSHSGFLKFKCPKEEADITYLTEKELMKIYEYDFSNNKRLEQVRDTFCLGCFTGMRFSDIAGLKEENVKEDELHISTQKTRDKLIIPLNEFSKEILKKYNCKLPSISNQKSNDYLKEIGEIAGIDEPILKVQYRGAEEIQTKEPKYNFISTHTARRTFVTLSLEKGMRAETVMSITGHKDYKTFKKYIKITNKVKLVEMNNIWSKERKLKVV